MARKNVLGWTSPSEAFHLCQVCSRDYRRDIPALLHLRMGHRGLHELPSGVSTLS